MDAQQDGPLGAPLRQGPGQGAEVEYGRGSRNYKKDIEDVYDGYL